MNITFSEFLIMALACFRLTRLIVFDDINAFIRAPFFIKEIEKNEEGDEEIYFTPVNRGIKGFFGKLLSCYWCTGIWSSLFLVLLYSFMPTLATPFILLLAIAGLAAIIESLIQLWLAE